MLLPEGNGQIVPYGYSRSDFCRDALARLPEVAERTDLSFDLLHPFLGDLAGLAREAIPARDHDFLRRLFRLLDDAIGRPDADPEIENAIAISFLEPPDFMLPHGNEAWRLVSPKLRRLIEGSP